MGTFTAYLKFREIYSALVFDTSSLMDDAYSRRLLLHG